MNGLFLLSVSHVLGLGTR